MCIRDSAKTANVFPYFDDPQKYIEEISVEDAAAIISLMDSDDAVDILEQLDPERKNRIVDKLHGRIAQDVKRLMSYDEREMCIRDRKEGLEQIQEYQSAVFWSFSRKDYQKTNWWSKTARADIGSKLTIRTANTVRRIVDI